MSAPTPSSDSQASAELSLNAPAPNISIMASDMEEPPSYYEARNDNLAAGLPSDVPSLHSPSIIELPHHPIETDGARARSSFDVPDIMPTLSMLGAPHMLFSNAVPYYLMLTCNGPSARLSGSHQPSLRLVAEYFKKWGRMSPPKPGVPLALPLIEVKIFGSRFSQRDYVDVAVISTKLTRDERETLKSLDINPAMIVGFILGVLGYRIIHIGNDVWHFQRDKELLVLT